jgi:diguanylate cyclase (GGDEF)-like protein/PAS domain S-box-containing protein
VAILAIGISLSVITFNSVRIQDEFAVKTAFQRAAETHASEITQGIDQSVQLIRSVDALFQATGSVSKEGFHAFVQPLLKQYPGVQAVEWVPRIKAEQLEQFEKRAQQAFPGFRITERLQQDKMIPAKTRPEYYPVYYIEPYEGNELASGFDLGSTPTRLQPLMQARDTGNIVASSRIVLVQDKSGLFGFLLFDPVYRIAQPSTPVERRDSLLGFALGVFRIKDVVEHAMSRSKPLGLDLAIYDESSDPSTKDLYTHLSRTRNKLPESLGSRLNPDSELTFTDTLSIGGHTWALKFTAAPGYYDTSIKGRTWTILLVGIAVALAMAAYVQIIRRHEEALALSEARLSEAQRIAGVGNWEWNILENKGSYSEEAYRIFGERSKSLEAAYEAFLEIVHPEDKTFVVSSIETAIATKSPLSIDHRIVYPDGTERFVHEQGEVISDTTGKAVRMVGTVQDITERKRAEEQIYAASLYARSLIEASLDPLFIMDQEGKITDANKAMVAVTGVPRSQLLGSDCAQYFMEPEKARSSLEEVLAKGIVANDPMTMKHVSGKKTEVLYNASTYFDDKGEIAGITVKARDITDRKRAEEAEEQASRDGLTKLFNHRTFYALLNEELGRAKRYKRPLSLLMLDIDHFKRVNDTHGHIAGDAVLRGLGHLLLKQARTTDCVCRYGGEEFTVILPETDRAAAVTIAERLRKMVEFHSFDIGTSKSLRITVSIGVATYLQHAESIEALVKASDMALYAAKGAGRNRVCCDHPESTEKQTVV